MGEVLVLNGSYQPIRAVSWQRAVTLWFRGKAEVLENYDDRYLHSQRLTINMPAVVRLTSFFKGMDTLLNSSPPFTRKNIYERDQGKCQYCGKKISIDKMTLDHVLPRAKGGKKEWDNVVTSCIRCNMEKANMTPAEAGMPLQKHPKRPAAHSIFLKANINHYPHPSWTIYLRPLMEMA